MGEAARPGMRPGTRSGLHPGTQPGMGSAELRRALADPDWRVRLQAISVIAARRDVRFEGRLKQLARFHLAPREVREAARAAQHTLAHHREVCGGRLSLAPRRSQVRLVQYRGEFVNIEREQGLRSFGTGALDGRSERLSTPG